MSLAIRIDKLDHRFNYIINGAFDFWQRFGSAATTVNTATPSSALTADRWRWGTDGATTKNFLIARTTDVPTFAQSGFMYPFGLQMNVLSAIGSPAVGDVVSPMQYRIEGIDYAKLHGKTCTLGFWIKLTAPSATFPVTLHASFNNNAGRTYVTPYTVNANSTWEFKTVTIQFETSTATYTFNTGIGMKIDLAASALGTNYQTTTTNSWQGNGDKYGTSTTFNIFNNTSNVLKITGVQLIEGSEVVASNFARSGLSIGGELQLCQRYFEKSYDIDVPPGSQSGSGAQQFGAGTSTHRDSWATMNTRKRAVPTFSTYNPSNTQTVSIYTPGSFNIHNRSGNNNVPVSIGDTGEMRFNVNFAPTPGNHYQYQWAADAEL